MERIYLNVSNHWSADGLQLGLEDKCPELLLIDEPNDRVVFRLNPFQIRRLTRHVTSGAVGSEAEIWQDDTNAAGRDNLMVARMTHAADEPSEWHVEMAVYEYAYVTDVEPQLMHCNYAELLRALQFAQQPISAFAAAA